jgi:hypothetical protein
MLQSWDRGWDGVIDCPDGLFVAKRPSLAVRVGLAGKLAYAQLKFQGVLLLLLLLSAALACCRHDACIPPEALLHIVSVGHTGRMS